VELLLNLRKRSRSGVCGEGYANLCRKVSPILIGIGDDNITSPGVTRNGGSHDADGTGSSDEDIFAEDRECQRGMDGVAERVEDGGDLMADAGSVLPYVGHRQDNVLREGPVAIDPDSLGVGAEMAATGEAVAAASADDVPLAADKLADGKVGDIGAEFDHLADELVANHETGADGGTRPGIPIVDMEVSSADARVEDADFDVIDTDLGFGDVLKPQAAFAAAFYECLHRVIAFPLQGSVAIAG
jgi:hypothetical protein